MVITIPSKHIFLVFGNLFMNIMLLETVLPEEVVERFSGSNFKNINN